MSQLEDGYARRVHYLRLSITEQCNFRCCYCLPEGYHPAQRYHPLTLSEIGHLTQAFAAMGTGKVRLTGGEPTLRRDVTAIIETVANTSGIEKVTMTTNGHRLKERINEWRSAGLTGLNVSVDSLDPRQFQRITGENKLAEVMAGIDAALEVGFPWVKVNTVLLKGLNDHELATFLTWVKTRPIVLRFIELMQTGDNAPLFAPHHVRAEAIKAQLIQTGWAQQPHAIDAGPAQVFRHPDYLGGIGLIMPYSQGFCASCNRLRVSSQGRLHLCLFGKQGIPLRDLLVDQGQQAELIARVHLALRTKALGDRLQVDDGGHIPHLASLGG